MVGTEYRLVFKQSLSKRLNLRLKQAVSQSVLDVNLLDQQE